LVLAVEAATVTVAVADATPAGTPFVVSAATAESPPLIAAVIT